MRGISLTWLLGLPGLTLLAWTGLRLNWSPRSLWRGLLVLSAGVTPAYLVRVSYLVATLP